MIRVIALITAGFLFLSSLEAWAGYWLAGRWFVSSRFASVSLGIVKDWLNRGIVNSATQTAKVFINRNGKWILLTLALSEIITEVQQRVEVSQYCFVQSGVIDLIIGSYGNGSTTISYDAVNFVGYTVSCNGGRTCSGASYNYQVPRYYLYRNNVWRGEFPKPGTYVVSDGCATCTFNVYWKVELSPCGSGSSTDWQNQRRQIPVRVFPNPLDFVRPDVVSSDPSLSWLRDEYQRISQDSSIPQIPSDALSGVDLPSVDWSIPPEEAIDQTAESSRPGENQNQGENEGQGDIPIPGLDTSLPNLEKRPFPVELINNLIANHPLLRILGNIHFDAGSGGSCEIGSGTFRISFCDYAWVLNLMGAIIVPIAFLIGLFGWKGD